MKITMFNMIEIVLAIGIAAFGIMAVVAMIPPALNANRDVAADSFAQEAASKMVFLMKNSWSNVENLPSTKQSVSSEYGENVFSHDEMKQWNIFKQEDGVFRLKSSDETLEVSALLWKENIADFENGITDNNASSYRVFLEISWPVNADYNRQKRLICFEVYKRNP